MEDQPRMTVKKMAAYKACHQHIATQQKDVDHTIQETRLNTLHLRSIQSPWSTNLARQCPTSRSFPALAVLAFTHPTPTTQAALAVSKTEQYKALDMDTESWRQSNERGGKLFINNSRRRKRRKEAVDELAPERNAITPKDLKFLTGVAIATETVASIVVSLTTWHVVLKPVKLAWITYCRPWPAECKASIRFLDK